ncbi:hypothetical protein AAFC00_003107 [Neodothiora populina]|uniref:Geranylgeranyl pyrophosphate synthetase n=1 Tax=Neodothiora populina TaxID=2781224 RepID=A0ABR3P9B8_9PEZI
MERSAETRDLPLGLLVRSVTRDALDENNYSEDSVAKISDCDYIASYNWTTDKHPTIIVPGEPPCWSPPDKQGRLDEDSGIYYRDSNAAKYSDNPTEPGVRALLQEDMKLETNEIDVFACGSILRSLLQFVSPDTRAKPFGFLVELVGNTVFFMRREKSPTQIIEDVRGFGHSFPARYCAWDAGVAGSDSHQRLIRYNLGGLACIVRSQTDGYPPDLAELKLKHAPEADDQARFITPAPAQTKLSLERTGRRIPQDSIFDLKTRSIKCREMINTLEEELPRLWLTQTPNFVLAYHKQGLFAHDDIEIIDVREKVKDWEEENVKTIARLMKLMKIIIAAVKARKDGRLEVVCTMADRSLELREQTDDLPAALPPVLMALWSAGGGGGITAAGAGATATNDVRHAGKEEGEDDDDKTWSGGSDEDALCLSDEDDDDDDDGGGGGTGLYPF